MLIVHTIVNQPVPSNCYVLYDKTHGDDCIVIDPGSKSNDELDSFLNKMGLNLQYIILTHEHFDHCWGVNDLVDRYGCPIVCSVLCAECIRFEKRNCSVYYNHNERFVITRDVISVESLGFVLPFAETELHFILTPGHSEASICFFVQRCLFTGDTVIKDVRTVTKLPTGSVSRLKESLRCIKELKGRHFIVYPGHGDSFGLDDYELGKAL